MNILIFIYLVLNFIFLVFNLRVLYTFRYLVQQFNSMYDKDFYDNIKPEDFE